MLIYITMYAVLEVAIVHLNYTHHYLELQLTCALSVFR